MRSNLVISIFALTVLTACSSMSKVDLQALESATKTGNISVIENLFEKYPDIPEKNLPLLYTAYVNKQFKVADWLVDNGVKEKQAVLESIMNITINELELFALVIDEHKVATKKYPSEEEFYFLASQYIEKYNMKADLNDEWGNKYNYTFASSRKPGKPDVFTFGADSVRGGVGYSKDVSIWDMPGWKF